MGEGKEGSGHNQRDNALGLLGHLLRSLQEHLIGEDIQILANPLPAHEALLIHEEERPSCLLAHCVQTKHAE